MKTLRKRPVFVPAILGFRDLIWMLVATGIVLLISLNPELVRLALSQFIP